MSTENSPHSPDSGLRKFPSRRELHGSRIPVSSPSPKTDTAVDSKIAAGAGAGATRTGEAEPVPTPNNAGAPASASPKERPLPSRSSLHRDKAQGKASRKGRGKVPAQAPVKTPSKGKAPGDQEGSSAAQTGRGNVASAKVSAPIAVTAPARVGAPTKPTAPAKPGAPIKSGPPTRSAPPAKRKGNGKRTAFRAVILILLAGLVVAAVWWAYESLRGARNNGATAVEVADYTGPGTGQVEITISPGDLGSDIGETLYEAGVVKSVSAFTQAFNSNSAAATIRPGTYTLKKEMSAAGALAALLEEANRSGNSVTITPGQALDQIKERLTAVAGFTEESIDEALKDTAALGLPAEADGSVEGWLAAGTYEVTLGLSPTVVLSEMVAATKDILMALEVPESQWQETLIKASILEREVISHTDLPKVARVIENRLTQPNGETAGFLQMDSTVLYGVGKYGGIPTASELATESPYNTYRVKGLPPTPISTPSLEAIEATVNPADGDWLYFVTVDLDTGETLFASTLDEQINNQKLLDSWCAANPGRC